MLRIWGPALLIGGAAGALLTGFAWAIAVMSILALEGEEE